MDLKKGPRWYMQFGMVELTSPEEYETELERMNAAMMAENQALQHDNKQLNTLIKEYETTLETVMGLFRQRAVRSLSVSFTSYLFPPVGSNPHFSRLLFDGLFCSVECVHVLIPLPISTMSNVKN